MIKVAKQEMLMITYLHTVCEWNALLFISFSLSLSLGTLADMEMALVYRW
jgi:hypothetical protein